VSALPITPEEVQVEPIVGWRVWRVVEIKTLAAGRELRLAAAGRYGLPPHWPPLQPITAVCSKFNSRHEAPWPSHECGVYALRTRRLTEERLESFVDSTNGDKAEAWAIGQVSLWGRVVECERGWRGQYAYPYALTVLSDDETLARRLAAVYAVDVDTAPPLPAPPPVEAGDDDEQEAAALPSRLTAIRTELESLEQETQTRLEQLQAQRVAQPAAVQDTPIATDVSRDDVLTAFYLHAARYLIDPASWRWRHLTPRQRNLALTDDLALVLLWQRGFRHHWAGISREFPADEVAASIVGRRVASELRKMKRDGLVESGQLRSFYQTKYVRLTKTGLASLTSLRHLPAHLRTVHQVDILSEEGEARTHRVVRARVLHHLQLPPALFTFEVDALKPQLAAERAAARAKGGRAFERYLARVRAGDDFGEVRLYYTEEETLAALRQAFVSHRRQPVSFQQLMAVLAPGDYGKEEAARLSAVLVKLRKARKVKKVSAGNPNARRWQPARP
jgi:hypothetical protein